MTDPQALWDTLSIHADIDTPQDISCRIGINRINKVVIAGKIAYNAHGLRSTTKDEKTQWL